MENNQETNYISQINEILEFVKEPKVNHNHKLIHCVM